MTVAEVAHEQKRALWNHGGSSDEIFNRGWWHLVSTPTPASEYLRDLPRCLERQAPALRKICIVYSTRGPFASHVARGFVQAVTSEYSASSCPIWCLTLTSWWGHSTRCNPRFSSSRGPSSRRPRSCGRAHTCLR